MDRPLKGCPQAEVRYTEIARLVENNTAPRMRREVCVIPNDTSLSLTHPPRLIGATDVVDDVAVTISDLD